MRGAPGLSLTDAQKLDWLQLIRSENVGPRGFRQLVNRFGGAGAALDALPGLLRSGAGARAIRLFSREAAEREYEATLAAGARFLALGESDYPKLLRTIADPPPLLILKGRAELLSRPSCAIVGSRNASLAGLAMAERLARALAHEGYAVVSGLARGIDGAAHRAALSQAGEGGTVGVLAGGLNRPYPSEHRELAERIGAEGALITEAPFDAEPRGRDFPRRNRIVSGLALATVVVEAARKSGSLITARFALEQNRSLFAVPGSPLDPRAEGTNDLLREGAQFCTGPEDLLQAMGSVGDEAAVPGLLFAREQQAPAPLQDGGETSFVPGFDNDDDELSFATETTRPPAPPADEAQSAPAPARDPQYMRRILLSLLGPTPVPLDDVIRLSGIGAADMRRLLLELELEGRLVRHGGTRISLAPPRE